MSKAGLEYLTALIYEIVVATDDLRAEDLAKKLSAEKIQLRTKYNYLSSWMTYRDKKKDEEFLKLVTPLVEAIKPYLEFAGGVAITKENSAELSDSLSREVRACKDYISRKSKKVFTKKVFGGWELVRRT